MTIARQPVAVTLRLPLEDDDGLMVTTHFDWEMSWLADRHYSRRTVGARQFLYSGRKLVLRNAEGTVLFAWLFPDPSMRMDGQSGYNCAIFRNESTRKASEIILACERRAFAKWGPNRLYTYVDPKQTRVIKRHGARVVGFCFVQAGWTDTGQVTATGKHLLVKEPTDARGRPGSGSVSGPGFCDDPASTEVQAKGGDQ